MKKVRSLIGVLALLASSISHAYYEQSIVHENGGNEIDIANESVALFLVTTGNYFYHEATIRQSDSVTDVTVEVFPNNFLATTRTYPIWVPIRGNNVVIKLLDQYSSDILLTKEFPVVNSTPAGKTAINDISGTWYMPTMPGMGFVAIQARNGNIFQFYGYSKTGERLWLVTDVDPTIWVAGQKKTLVVYEGAPNNGANFNTKANPVNGNTSGMQQWGTLDITFDSCTKANAKLTGADGEQTYKLTKLANLRNIRCSEVDSK